MKSHKLEIQYQSNEYLEMPESLSITLNPDAELKLKQIAKLMKDSAIKIEHINIASHEIFDADFNEFDECDFRVGGDYIRVYSDGGWYLRVENKYDSSAEAEYHLAGNKDN